MWRFALGIKARDRITGVEGTVTARCEYLDFPRRYMLVGARITGGTFEDWFVEDRLEAVDTINKNALTEVLLRMSVTSAVNVGTESRSMTVAPDPAPAPEA